MFRSSGLVQRYYKLNMRRAGLKKYFVSIDSDAYENVIFCYCERGVKVAQQPSLIFIHGFSSDKHAWTDTIKYVPSNYHLITVDMPGHGETVGFKEEHLIATKIVDVFKLFLDKLKLTEPMCIIGTSMGGSIVTMFATKYPLYIAMICLLAPVPPGEEYETDLLKKLRSGTYEIVLPETREQFYAAASTLSMAKIRLRRLLAEGYLKYRLNTLDQHKRILKSAFENDYPNLAESYSQLGSLSCPALILWGRQDQLCAVEGAEYFSRLLLNAEVIIFDDCGHMIIMDKSKETANNIINFWNKHHSFLTRL